MDITAGKKMIEAVKGYVARALDPLAKRIDQFESRIPEKGDKGDKGDRGESVKGDRGDDVDPAVVRGMVAAEIERAVAAIPKPRDGDRGVDAAELDILPSIDELKSYRRGTWASHAGGLIRAARATDPVTDGLTKAGWVVMVEGVAGIVVTQNDDPREMTVATMLTSGTKAISDFRVPMVLDFGVWREGSYQKGDGTTFGGSFWIAQRETLPTEKPGESDAWRLSVKRGRDGADKK